MQDRCCVHCFRDWTVRDQIESEGVPGHCDYCRKKRARTIRVGVLSGMFADAIREHYSPISPDNTLWDGEDHQYMQEGELLYDLIQEDWEVFADERQQLLEDILDAGWTKDDPDWPTASGTEWTARDTPFRERGDALADTWEGFCREMSAAASTATKIEAAWGEWLPKDSSCQNHENEREDAMLDRFSIGSQGRGSGHVPAAMAKPTPSRLADIMREALAIKRDMETLGWTLKKAAWKHGVREDLAQRMLALTRLEPTIQGRILLLTAEEHAHITLRKLSAFVVPVSEPQLQREMFKKLLAGELKLAMPRRPKE